MNIYPLTRENLDTQAKEGKEDCNCGGPWAAHLMDLSPSCHPGIGMVLSYHPNTGCLFLSCPTCKQAFGMIQVAKEINEIFEGVESEQIIAVVMSMSNPSHSKPSSHPSRN